MRLSRVLPALCLLFGVCASQLDSRLPHTLDTRELLDVCATITNDLFNFDINKNVVIQMAGLINVCLCLSVLPLAGADMPPGMGAFWDIGGESFVKDVNAALPRVIIKGAARDNCLYPDHSKPFCGLAKCAFECIDGFTPFPQNNPTGCRCEETLQVCNGQCVAKGACFSQQTRSNRRRWLGSGSCAKRGYGWLACGVYGNHPSAWECVNTASDLESCGGCVVPLTGHSPRGKDCSAIPGVADVACEWGKCVVRDCLHGLVPSADANNCVPKSEYEDSHRHHHHHHHHQHGEMEDESAKAYGLEHIPLQIN